jgi:hypothetical protein
LEGEQQLKLNVLCSLHLVETTWCSVTSDTREHCFSKAGFGVVDLSKNVEDAKLAEEHLKIMTNQAFIFMEFVHFNEHVMTVALLSVEVIVVLQVKTKI